MVAEFLKLPNKSPICLEDQLNEYQLNIASFFFFPEENKLKNYLFFYFLSHAFQIIDDCMFSCPGRILERERKKKKAAMKMIQKNKKEER